MSSLDIVYEIVSYPAGDQYLMQCRASPGPNCSHVMGGFNAR
jgi:hypothetical protein